MSNIPEEVLEAIEGVIYEVAMDGAQDSSDFSGWRAAYALAEACIKADPNVKTRLIAAREAAYLRAAENCGKPFETFQPCSPLDLP